LDIACEPAVRTIFQKQTESNGPNNLSQFGLVHHHDGAKRQQTPTGRHDGGFFPVWALAHVRAMTAGNAARLHKLVQAEDELETQMCSSE
jgi:hypothetical protein